MSQHKIYALCEPGTLEVRYVGRTCQQLRHRLRKHISNSKTGNTPSAVWIRSITATGLEPDIRLLAVCTSTEVVGVERAWIAMFIDNGFDLLNVLETEQPECKQYKRAGRLTAGNIKSLGVPSDVHAKAREMAQRYDNTITKFMDENGLSQADVARRLGYQQSHVSMVINGQRRVTDGFRYRWLEAFGAKALSHLNGDTEPQE